MSLLTFGAGGANDILPIRAEMYIGGAWTDITSRIRLANEIVINSRGRANEQGRPGVCTCSFTLNNGDQYFSNRAILGANYGKLGPNTPFRVSVTEDRSFAALDNSTDAARVRTVDKASISTTGDLDIRIEFEPYTWDMGDSGHVLAAKWRRTASANRSWALTTSPQGYPILWHSTDGTFFSTYYATSPLPTQYGAVALRCTIDVDNGAAGRTVTFYTSDSISGTWTTLGTPVVTAGTVTGFDSTADLELGRLDDGQRAGLIGGTGLAGRIYAFELRHVIGGALVANAAISSQARGTTSWSDGLGTPNTWLVESTAEITPDDRRFYGEVASLPQQWDISGRDVFVPAQAADVTRRLQQGGVPVTSAWTKYWQGKVAAGYLSATTPVTGMWPLEDGATATQAANIVPRGAPATIVNCSFGAAADLPASDNVMTLSAVGSKFYGQCRKTIPNVLGPGSFANFAFKMPSVPASSTTLMDFKCLGDIGRCNISVTATTYVVAIYDPDGVLITSAATLFGPPVPNAWVVMRLQFTQSGATGKVDLGWYHPGDNVLYGAAALTFVGSSGNIVGFNVQGTAGNAGTQYSQLAIGNYFLNNTTYEYTITASAFAGESTTQRWTRVCTENGISGSIVGTGSGELMGSQQHTSAMELLYQVMDAEQGIMYASRRDASIILRTRPSLYNQYGPSLSYAAGDLGNKVPLPTDDDQQTRNVVTASRSGGSSATSTVDTGPKSTQAPPNGVGVYTSPITREVYSDDRLDDMAAWDAFLGTWDEPRWPQVRVDLERTPFTGTAAKITKLKTISHLDVANLFTLTGLVQTGIPPDDAKLMIQGVTETLGNRKWWIEFNTSPYGPWVTNNLTSVTANSKFRVAAANCTVTTGFAATGVASFQVSTATGSTLWGTTLTKPGNFPIDIVIAGEVITISGISGTTSPQTFTVSARGVNNGGVGKAQLAGATVQVKDVFYPVL